MSIAYFLVTATYMTIGAAFYVTFPLPKVRVTTVKDLLGLVRSASYILKWASLLLITFIFL